MIKNYIFLGAPGVGKGTLAVKLYKEKGYKHISTGEMFRRAIKNETELGIKVKKIIAAGDYVPDELTNALVKEVLDSKKVKESGFILDGYPRTINQSEFLKENGYKLDGAILLEASDEVVFDRLINRKRADDNPDIIKNRIEVYNKQTKPLIDFYEKENLLIRINAEGTVEENYKNLLEGIK